MFICLGTTPAVQRVMSFDRLVIGGVNRTSRVVEAAAGKAINVAKVLAALKQPVMATGFLGGNRGQFLQRELSWLGIGQDFVAVEPETRQCVTLIDSENRTHTELVEEAQAVRTEAYAALLQKLRSLLGPAKMLILSGTLPPGAPADFYARCARLAHEHGVESIVDATGPALAEALAAGPLAIKPNRSELGLALKMPVDSPEAIQRAMARAVELGARNVVVTLGAAGAMAHDGRRFWHIRIPALEVVNTIGSGDAFTAGLAAGLAQSRSLPDAAKLGAACGCANALTELAGEVHGCDIDRLLPEVEAMIQAE